jgi:hypothetical protein
MSQVGGPKVAWQCLTCRRYRLGLLTVLALAALALWIG